LTEKTSTGVVDPGGQERPAPRVRARTLRIISAVLAVVFLAAVVAAVWFGLKARDDREAEKERAAAANVASQFALRMDKVDGTDFDGYIKGVNDLLTTKAKTKNTEVFNAMKQSYETAKVKGSGKVLLTAVGDSDEDSATVLVVHDADVTTTQGNIEHHYRWTVNVVKVNGDWLVDDFNPVN
jgi:Mce-associated membrane protein